MSSGISLFDSYPALRSCLPHVALGSFPTPLTELKGVGSVAGCRLFYKDDGLSGVPYGGNKIRKLEFLLGEALQKRASEVITFGYAGSNHALATAVYAKECGVGCTSMLMPQLNADYVRKNLLYGFAAGASLASYPSAAAMYLPTMGKVLGGILRKRKAPYIVPAGGSSPLGAVGYVNAAWELKDQIDAGLIPEPDVLYVALGTMGTAAGLAVGLKAVGLRTVIEAIRVVDARWANRKNLDKLVQLTGAYLKAADPAFPDTSGAEKSVSIRSDYFGGEYARFTLAAREARDLLVNAEGIELDVTYTAKAMAAVLNDFGKEYAAGRNVLFWGTCNSRTYDDIIAGVSWKDLPRPFHRYFEAAS